MNAYFINVLREVRHSLGRFLALFLIVGLGVGFLAGLMSTAPDMRESADQYYDQTNMMDLRVVASMGLTENDLEAVRRTGGVESVAPGYQADLLAELGSGGELVARVHSVPASSYPNQLILQEGRYPERAGECVIVITQTGAASQVGEHISLATTGELRQEDYQIVGAVSSPYYMSIVQETSAIGDGKVGMVLYVLPTDFRLEAYTDLYVRVGGVGHLQTFSSAYQRAVEPVKQALQGLGEERMAARREQLRGVAQRELRRAEQAYAEQQQQVEDELRQKRIALDQNQARLDQQASDISKKKDLLLTGRQRLDQDRKDNEAARLAAEQLLSEGQATLDAARVQLAGQKNELDALRAGLGEQLDELEALRQQAAAGELTDEQAARMAELETVEAAYLQQEAQYLRSESELNAQSAELDRQRSEQAQRQMNAEAGLDAREDELYQLQYSLSAAEQAYKSAAAGQEQGEKEYVSAERQAEEALFDASTQIRDAQSQLNAIETPTWQVLDRTSVPSYTSFANDAGRVEAIARVFPVFFFLLAALVALTTMTRMVEEQRGQIGLLTALGYGKQAIAGKYLLYAGAAGVLGCAAGLAVGLRVFPLVIWQVYEIGYYLPELTYVFHWGVSLFACLGALFCVLGATYLAAMDVLRDSPSALLLPLSPKPGKRMFFEHASPLWKRMSFSQRATLRNLVRYKRRFFMTVLGVAGCVALLLTGFGLRDSLSEVGKKQFGELMQFDLMLGLRHSGDDQEDPRIRELLANQSLISDWLPIGQENATAFTPSGQGVGVELIIPRDTRRLKEFITLRSRSSGKEVPLAENAAVLSEKLASQLDVKPGDLLTVENSQGVRAQVSVSGITENYVQSYIYLSDSLYRHTFGGQVAYTTVLATTPSNGPAARQTLSRTLLREANISSVMFTQDMSDSFSNMLSQVDSLVVLLLICAGLLAFVVLYNLTSININERQKELATMKVLGFYEGEIATYIFRETMCLSLVGTALGLVIGLLLHLFVVRTAETSAIMLGRQISGLAFVMSVGLTLTLTLLINGGMARTLRRIPMADSVKAPE